MFSKLLGKLNRPSRSIPPIAPDEAFYVIGDIHGRIDLLERLLAKLDFSRPVIAVGDYVDRGEDSADVLKLLFARDDMICLKGNHEEMLLRFLDSPARHGSRWLRYGGLQTLASFGIAGVTESSAEPALQEAGEKLKTAMGPDLLDWVQNLPVQWQSGNVAVVHAAADPELPMPLQSDRTLLWGHEKFGIQPREDDKWIVHGHTIVDQAVAENGIVSIDTGAYATGRMTAALISPGGVEFIAA